MVTGQTNDQFGSYQDATPERATSDLQAKYLVGLLPYGVVPTGAEYYFHPTRKWRVDYVWLVGGDCQIAVEINGGQYTRKRDNQGVLQSMRHQHPSAVAGEADKLNALNLAGFCVLVFWTSQVDDGTAVETTLEALNKFNYQLGG